MQRKQQKWKIFGAGLILIVLAAAFWYGGDAPGSRGWTAAGPGPQEQQGEQEEGQEEGQPVSQPVKPDQGEERQSPRPEPETPDSQPEQKPAEPADSRQNQPEQAPGQPEPQPAPGEGQQPEPEPSPSQPQPGQETQNQETQGQDTQSQDAQHTCTVSISCAAVLDHMDWLDEDKAELVPPDGCLLAAAEVEFEEGESAFDVLQRVCRQQKIHLEFSSTPPSEAAYIEGIGNLYEMDCGQLSGWMYQVNGWFPNYSCSQYLLQPGDVISWQYSCDLGADIGASRSLGD